MTKRIILSMFLLAALALLGMNLARKNSSYTYSFNVPVIDYEKQHQEFMAQIYPYQKNLTIHPGAADDLAKLAQLYLGRAHEIDSREYFRTAMNYAYRSIHFMPVNNPVPYFVLADIALIERDYNKAIRLAQLILKQTSSRNPEAFIIIAKSQLALGNLEMAMNAADELIGVFPSEKAYTLRANILAEQRRDQEAIIDFEAAIKLLEDDPLQAATTRAMYAQFLINRGSQKNYMETAKVLLNEALRIAPQSSMALGLVGTYYQKEKNYTEAVKYYKAAFKQSKNINYLFLEARVQKLIGNHDFARILFGQIELLLRDDIKRNQRTFHNFDLIRLLLERGDEKDFPEALRLAAREKLSRPCSDGYLLYTWALEMNGQILEARKFTRWMLAKNIYSEEVLLRASLVEEKLKNKNLADIYKNQFFASRSL